MCAASASRTPERAGPRAASGGRGAAWVVGIDLGTTHTVVACAPLGDAAGSEAIRLFGIDQLVAPGELGLSNMTGIERTSYWGVEKPPSAVSVITGTTRASFLGAIGL